MTGLTNLCIFVADTGRRGLQKKAVYWDWEYVRHSLLAIARQLGFWVVAVLAKPMLGALIPLFRFGHRCVHYHHLCFRGSKQSDPSTQTATR